MAVFIQRRLIIGKCTSILKLNQTSILDIIYQQILNNNDL